jgi:hypothetical protein
MPAAYKSLLASMASIALLAACGGGSSNPPTTTIVVPVLADTTGLGAECATSSECSTGFCDRTVPGGQCTSECEADADCGGGSCYQGYCFVSCLSQRQCRSGEFDCFALPGRDDGICVFDLAAARPAEPNIGAPCRATVECGAPEGLSPLCMQATSPAGTPTPFVDGMCFAIGCTDDATCGAGAVCVGAENARLCAPACASDADCRGGYGCSDGTCVPAAR